MLSYLFVCFIFSHLELTFSILLNLKRVASVLNSSQLIFAVILCEIKMFQALIFVALVSLSYAQRPSFLPAQVISCVADGNHVSYYRNVYSIQRNFLLCRAVRDFLNNLFPMKVLIKIFVLFSVHWKC
jgi:hypothetical protein